jgi:hypothetical protein
MYQSMAMVNRGNSFLLHIFIIGDDSDRQRMKKNIKGLTGLIKSIFSALAFYLIYINVSGSQVVLQFETLKSLFSNNSAARLYFFLALLLMPVNWLIEAYKWKKITSRFFTLSLFKSLKAVMTGVAASFFTPNRSGDFAGRIIYLPSRQRITGAICSISGSLSQLLITVSAGCICLMFMLSRLKFASHNYDQALYIILPLVASLLHVLYFRLPALASMIRTDNFKWMRKVRIFRIVDKKMLLDIYILSILRYIVFTLQFFLLLMIFNISISPAITIILIMICFFLLSVIPTFALTEIGVRGSVCIYVFGLVAPSSSSGVLIASTLLWLINIVLPAITGATGLLSARIDK